jgi:hypothetical protein
MKTAIICVICDKPKRFSDSYAIKLTKYVNADSTTSSTGTVSFTTAGATTLKARACRTCTKRMGYKIKQAKIKVLKK